MQVDVFGETCDAVRSLSIEATSTYAGGVPMANAGLPLDPNADLQILVHRLREEAVNAATRRRAALRSAICASPSTKVIVLRGSDAAVDVVEALAEIPGKTIVLTPTLTQHGSPSDFAHDLAVAVSVVKILPPGVYQIIGGKVVPGHWRTSTATKCCVTQSESHSPVAAPIRVDYAPL